MIRLTDYASPDHEASLYKNLPIQLYGPDFMRLLRVALGIPLRVKFRGPRAARRVTNKHQAQSYCLKKDARTFAIYPRDWTARKVTWFQSSPGNPVR